MENQSVDDENACVDIDQSCSFEPPHLQSPDLSSFNAGNLSPIPTANSESKFYAVESLDSSLYKEDLFEKLEESSGQFENSEESPRENKSEKSPVPSGKSMESPLKSDQSPDKTDVSPQLSGLSPVNPGYNQFEVNKSQNNLNKSVADESSIYPDESLVLIDKYPILMNKSPPETPQKVSLKSSRKSSPKLSPKNSPKSPSRSPPPPVTQTEPSANEDSPITVMESPVRHIASNYHDHSSAYQSPNNVSRSYIISEDGSHHHIVDDLYEDQTDCEIDISKSYIVSEKTEVENSKRNGNPRLSDIVESRDSDKKGGLGETQSINMMPDSLEVRNTLQMDDLQVKTDDCDNSCKSDNNDDNKESEDEPPSLKSIKSIAERKRQKMMENRKKMEQNINTTAETTSNTESTKDEKDSLKKINRYSINNESTPKATRIARLTTKKASQLKIQKRTIKKPTMYARSDIHARNQASPCKDDKLQHDVKQLQILNEKERKNNLKMHQDMVAFQNKWKVEKQKLCSEYERKVSELNRQINVIKKSQRVIGGGAGSNTAAIDNRIGNTSDDDMIEKLQKQLEMQETMIAGFQEENKTLYNKLKREEASLKDVQGQNSDEKRKLAVDMDSLKMNHILELEKTEKKLKWYAENQVLLDQDMNELKIGRETIREMKITINQYELEIKRLKTENIELHKEINDKENMMAGKPNILQTMEPSPSNPIIAQKASNALLHSIENENQKPLTIYLEKRIKILENELEEKDNDSSRKIRAIEQKYSILTLEFEDEIKKLECKVRDLMLENKSLKESNIVEDIELLRNEHSIEILDLKNEISTNEEEIRLLKAKLSSEGPRKGTPMNLKLTDQHKKSLRAKDLQINDLSEKVLILEKDRKLLTEELQLHLAGNDFGKTYRQGTSNVQTTKRVHDELEDKYSAALAEVEKFKAYIDEIQIESEQRRLRYEAIDAQSQSEVRTLTEKYEEEKVKSEENFQRVIEKMKVDFAVEHSNSKVAELNAKVTGLELMMEHMKAMLEETRVERFNYMQLKQSEETLKVKVTELEKELIEAEDLGTPGVQEYKMLVAKINNMERNHSSREEKLKTIIEGMKSKTETDIEEIEEKWRIKLSQKDCEVNRFREELDSIIEVLEELQKQGVVLPEFDVVK